MFEVGGGMLDHHSVALQTKKKKKKTSLVHSCIAHRAAECVSADASPQFSMEDLAAVVLAVFTLLVFLVLQYVFFYCCPLLF